MKSLTKNMVMSILARIVTMITGLLVQQRILLAYGSSLNGLTSAITQLMSYLVLLEAGLGLASIQVLYYPLAQNDWKKISGIVSATGHEYKKISAAFFALLGAAAVLLPLVVADEVEFAVATLLTLITGGSYIVSYIIGGKYKVVLNADRKLYVLYALDIITTILSTVVRIWLLSAGYSIVIVQGANLLCTCLKNVAYIVYVRREYDKIDYKARPDFGSVSKRWNVLVHNLAGLVVNHTDVMILTLFGSLKIVSVYSVYNMVYSQLSATIQTTFLSAPQSNFGRIFHHDRDRFKDVYAIFEFVVTVLLFIVVTIAVLMTLPFVSIYTHGVEDVQYINFWLPIMFALILMFNQIRIPALMTINVSGDFKETQKGAIIEAVINLTVSLFLYFLTPLGLYGLLIGTVCSYLYRTADVISYTYRHILKCSMGSFVKLLVVNATCGLALFCMFYIWHPLQASTIGEWCLIACGIGALTVSLYMAVNCVFNRTAICSCIQIAKNWIRRQ